MKRIVIIGAGGLAGEVIEAIKLINEANRQYDLIGCVVEEKYFKEGMSINGYDVVGTLDWLISHKDEVYAHCAVGIPKEKARLQRDLKEKGIRFETIISPDVHIASNAVIGEGVFMPLGVYVSTYCKVGDGVLLNGQVILGHDTEIGEYTCIMTRTELGGRCHVGKEVLIGAHAYILPDRKIGDEATVAAGSIVFSNVKAGTTVIGNPAKRMRCLEE